MATQPGGSVTSRAASESRSANPGSSGGHSSNTATGAKFRHGLLQLMIHTIDPLHDGKSFTIYNKINFRLSVPHYLYLLNEYQIQNNYALIALDRFSHSLLLS